MEYRSGMMLDYHPCKLFLMFLEVSCVSPWKWVTLKFFYIVLERNLKTEFSSVRKKFSDIIKEYKN